MKIICPHCGQVIEIEGISLPQSRALMVNINALLDEADIEYDSRKQAVKIISGRLTVQYRMYFQKQIA